MMNVNGRALLLVLEASLTDLLPLPDRLGQASNGYHIPDLPGRHQHGELLGWREIVEVTYIPGFGQHWLLVPLSGGRVVLAWAGAIEDSHLAAARRWQEKALPVLVILDSDSERDLHA